MNIWSSGPDRAIEQIFQTWRLLESNKNGNMDGPDDKLIGVAG
jgi:hypothetical protein